MPVGSRRLDEWLDSAELALGLDINKRLERSSQRGPPGSGTAAGTRLPHRPTESSFPDPSPQAWRVEPSLENPSARLRA